MAEPLPSGGCWVSSIGGYISEADVRADDAEVARERIELQWGGSDRGITQPLPNGEDFWARVASTHPGIVRTLHVLMPELTDLDGMEPDVQEALGHHLRQVGCSLVDRATGQPQVINLDEVQYG